MNINLYICRYAYIMGVCGGGGVNPTTTTTTNTHDVCIYTYVYLCVSIHACTAGSIIQGARSFKTATAGPVCNKKRTEPDLMP